MDDGLRSNNYEAPCVFPTLQCMSHIDFARLLSPNAEQRVSESRTQSGNSSELNDLITIEGIKHISKDAE